MAITTASPAVYSPQYSSVGAALAKEGRHSYEIATQWTDADKFIGTALSSVNSEATTTADEKSIAVMGYNMGTRNGMQWQNSAQARYAAAGAIASALPGSLGAVMGHVMAGGFGPANRWDDCDFIMGQGLQAVRKNPNTSADQKDLAELGLAMGNHTGMQWQNSANARKAVADALIAPPATGTVAQLAAVTQVAFGAANRWDDADNIVGDGLLAVLHNAGSSDVQKALAKSALEQTSIAGITWENSARARLAAITQIRGDQKGPESEEVGSKLNPETIRPAVSPLRFFQVGDDAIKAGETEKAVSP